MRTLSFFLLVAACQATRLTLYNHCDFEFAVQKFGSSGKLKHFCTLTIDGNFTGKFDKVGFGIKELWKNLYAEFYFNRNGMDYFDLNASNGRIGSSMKIVADHGDSILCTDDDCSQAISNPSEANEKIHHQRTGGQIDLHFCPDNMERDS